jgi:hypothetical protein
MILTLANEADLGFFATGFVMPRGIAIMADNIHKITKFVTLCLFYLISNNLTTIYTYNIFLILNLSGSHISISLTLYQNHLLMIPSSSLPMLGWGLCLLLSSWQMVPRRLPPWRLASRRQPVISP